MPSKLEPESADSQSAVELDLRARAPASGSEPLVVRDDGAHHLRRTVPDADHLFELDCKRAPHLAEIALDREHLVGLQGLVGAAAVWVDMREAAAAQPYAVRGVVVGEKRLVLLWYRWQVL